MAAKCLLWALVPRVCIPIESMLVNNLGKVDHRKLSASLQSMTVDKVRHLNPASAPAAGVKCTP
ncbi:hypothetical protein LX36DRAFT_653722 [Colletotrichum falcatum]|nr:hypothetical protein LX36DRAFT_653722 [Colletotrichum falcatum]